MNSNEIIKVYKEALEINVEKAVAEWNEKLYASN
jgi:hypothetical protein